jgi:hypothetical protein
VRYAADLAQWRKQEGQLKSDAAKVIKLLSGAPDGMTRSKLLRRVRIPASHLQQVLDSLEADGRVAQTRIPTSGNTLTIVSLP